MASVVYGTLGTADDTDTEVGSNPSRTICMHLLTAGVMPREDSPVLCAAGGNGIRWL